MILVKQNAIRLIKHEFLDYYETPQGIVGVEGGENSYNFVFAMWETNRNYPLFISYLNQNKIKYKKIIQGKDIIINIKHPYIYEIN